MVLPQTWQGRMKAQAIRAADRAGPMASSARENAYARIQDARVWAAPKLKHAARSVEYQLAPRVSMMLEEASRRVDPTPMQMRTRSSWPTMVLFGGMALGAIGFMMYRRNAQHWAEVMRTSADEVKAKAEEATESMKPQGSRKDGVSGKKP
ncbi:hypothetical protein Aph01nite_16560 [Acrocarpospora phusangensis]|uniref:Uncharacterized protein n=2 Tax=Acrocarpospora phusangensis TaxID=1070424 RepID=A0A919Q887_9ACTN|nr:hypothetical protein Aph01nite_16560 [Acrocarpospora phusangensis]